MIQELKNIEATLLEKLSQPDLWNTLNIDYHPPHVKRLWIQLGEHRLYLHIIEPCTAEEALFHSHPWPSAIHILEGKYEMGIGYSEKDLSDEQIAIRKKELPCKIEFNGEAYYEMSNKNGWHYVRPLERCYSVMLTGQQWDMPVSANKLNHKLDELDHRTKESALRWFKQRFEIYKEIADVDAKINEVKTAKNVVVRLQSYEMAATLRSEERKLLDERFEVLTKLIHY